MGVFALFPLSSAWRAATLAKPAVDAVGAGVWGGQALKVAPAVSAGVALGAMGRAGVQRGMGDLSSRDAMAGALAPVAQAAERFIHVARLMPTPHPMGAWRSMVDISAAISHRPSAAVAEGFRVHQPGPGWGVHPGGGPPAVPPVELETLPIDQRAHARYLPGRAMDVPDTRLPGKQAHQVSADDGLLFKAGEGSTLIVGGTGAFAPALWAVSKARAPDAPVYATSRHGQPPEPWRLPDVQYIATPRGIEDITPELLAILRPRYIFNLANTYQPSFDATFDVNVLERYKLLQTVDEYAQATGQRVGHPILSSHSAFREGEKLGEFSPSDAQTHYGVTTYLSEQLALLPRHGDASGKAWMVDVPVFRMPTLVGVPEEAPFVPRNAGRRQLDHWVKQAALTGSVQVSDRPQARRPYGYSLDVAAQMMNVMNHADAAVRNGLYVLGPRSGPGQALSTQEALDLVAATAQRIDGKKIHVQYLDTPPRMGHRSFTTDPQAYWAQFPDHVLTPIEQVIEHTYRHYREKPDLYRD